MPVRAWWSRRIRRAWLARCAAWAAQAALAAGAVILGAGLTWLSAVVDQSRLPANWPGAARGAVARLVLSPPDPAVPVPDKPLAGLVVAVDPGHGGQDRGACHLPSGLIEKEINLDMALRLERALREHGAEVILTRRDDTYVSLDDRAQLANERGAHVFLSLHVNRYPSPDCFGAQTFYLPSAREGRRLALLIQEELLAIYPPNYRQALPGNYRVLRVARMPAALVEIGFVTNAGDRALMQREDYREAVVGAIVRAVIRFARGETAGEPPSDGR